MYFPRWQNDVCASQCFRPCGNVFVDAIDESAVEIEQHSGQAQIFFPREGRRPFRGALLTSLIGVGSRCQSLSETANSSCAGLSRPFSGLLKDQSRWPVCGSSLCRLYPLYLSEAYGFSYAASRSLPSCPHLCRTCVHWISSSQPFATLLIYWCCNPR